MPRIRTIDKGYDEYRKNDPETALTKTALRRLIISGRIPSVKIGAKYLFDLDVLDAYLHGSILETAGEMSRIRRLKA